MITTCLEELRLSDEVIALVGAHAAESDASGHIHPDVVDALSGTGINRLMLPRELGGLAASPVVAFDAVERIATVDGSTAWAAAIGFGTNLFAGYLDRDGAAEVFADPDQPNAGVFAPMASVRCDNQGTLRLTGRWPFTSNCEQAAWIGLAARFPDETPPRLVFAPKASVTIHRTWDVAGLRATASNDTSLTDFAVDRRHTCSFTDRPWADGTLWRLPLFVALIPTLAAVGVGVARGAIDEIKRRAITRAEQMRGSLLDDAVGIADLAAADASLRGVRAGLLETIEECWSQAGEGGPVQRRLQARAMLASQHCLDVAVAVAGACHRLGGGDAAFRPSPLSRAVRDLETARQHMVFSHGLRPPLGRVLVGTDETFPPFVV